MAGGRRRGKKRRNAAARRQLEWMSRSVYEEQEATEQEKERKQKLQKLGGCGISNASIVRTSIKVSVLEILIEMH